MGPRHKLRIPALLIALASVAPAGWAQTTQPDVVAEEAPPATAPPPAHLLAGPKVEVAGEPAASVGLGGGQRDRRRMAVPPRRWFDMVRRLDLDSEQQREVRAILERFREAQRRFRVNHGRPLRELRRKARAARQEGEPLPMELRRQIRDLQSKAPKPPTYQQQVWEVLTLPQQERMQELLTVVRKEMAERRAKESATRRDPRRNESGRPGSD